MTSVDLISFTLALACPEPLKAPLEVAFVYRLPPGPSLEIAAHCKKLYTEKLVARFCFVDTGPASGTESAEAFAKVLEVEGIPPQAIVPIPYIYPEDHINTYYEADSFATWLKTSGISRTGVVAQPYHLVRAYLTMVSCLEKEGGRPGDICIYSLPCPIGSWSLPTTHSQGVIKGTKWELIDCEVERIERYQAKGDLLEISRGLEWLHHSIFVG